MKKSNSIGRFFNLPVFQPASLLACSLESLRTFRPNRLFACQPVGLPACSPVRLSAIFPRFTIHVSRFTVFVAFALFLTLPFAAQAADKLVVKDVGGNPKFVVTDTGKVGVGTSAPMASLHVVDTTTSIERGLISSQVNDNITGGVIVLRKSRGTEPSPASVLTGDYIGALQGQAFDGTAYQQSAAISYFIDGAISTGNVPMAMQIFTGTNNAARLERLRVTSSGNIGIGTSAPTQKLDVNSDSIRIRNSKTPASSSAACNQGEMSWSSSYVYVCVATNTWKRATLNSW